MTDEAFDADWLALREPVDHRSRAGELLEPLGAWWQERGASRVLDLGCGTGSNLRYLAPRLGGEQRWTLLDRDADLLARAGASRAAQLPGVAGVELVSGDLAREGIERVADADLVTASALLDLVSGDWLDRVVEACSRARCAGLFALTWDGEVRWRSGGEGAPEGPDDALVFDAVRAHQGRDKGVGAALGPAAGAAAERAFRAADFRTWLLASPWRLGPEDAALVCALVDGWEKAATEQLPGEADRIVAWAERRRTEARTRPFALEVGHVDLLALPPVSGR